MNVWPFRKSKTIYNWDDQYCPIYEPFTPAIAPKTWSFTCPNDYYCKIQRIVALFSRDGAVGYLTWYQELTRGGIKLSNYYQIITVQITSGYWISFEPDWFVYSTGATGYYMMPLQKELHMIPGDVFTIWYVGTYTGVTLNPAQIMLHAYYF
jgi:hypothetical protein